MTAPTDNTQAPTTLPPITPIGRGQLLNTASDRERVLAQISTAQVCGLGGGRFDTATKLRHGFGARAVIINGMQSEPGNNSDIALLHEQPQDVINGAALAAYAAGTCNITLALPNTDPLSDKLARTIDTCIDEQTAWLTDVLGAEVNFTCRHLPTGHASGEEHQLALALGLLDDTDTQQSANAPLVRQGIVCLNLATAHAIARAVLAGEPLTHRIISVNGTAQWVELGTPLDALARSNSRVLDAKALWVNGQHGGNPANVQSSNGYAHAGLFSINTAPPTPSAPCINCSACVPACPVGLRPDELHQQLEQGQEPAAHLRLADCIECGACNAVCPSGLWLAQSFRTARSAQRNSVEKDQLAQKAKARSDARSARLAAHDAKRAARVNQRSKQGKRAW